MGTFQNKSEFMQALRKELAERNITDTRDIMLDFEQHFDDGIARGLTEQEVCGKLGDLGEIVAQYQDEAAEMNKCTELAVPGAEKAEQPSAQQNAAAQNTSAQQNASDGFAGNTYEHPKQNTYTQNTAYNQPQQKANGFEPNVGGLIGAICVDLFVFSWALPALVGVICAYFSIPISLFISGLASVLCGMFGGIAGIIQFVSPFGPMSNVAFGIMLMALSGLAVLLAIVIVKGFIGIIISIINWHSKLIVGRDVIERKNKKKATAAQQA